jgi:hypothetical protein
VALIDAFLTATFNVDVLRPVHAPTRDLGSHAAFFDALVGLLGRCLLRFYFGRLGTEHLPNLGNDLLSGMFAFGLAILSCSIWCTPTERGTPYQRAEAATPVRRAAGVGFEPTGRLAAAKVFKTVARWVNHAP